MENVDKWIESVHTILMFGLEEELTELPGAEAKDSEPGGQNLHDVKLVLDELLLQARRDGEEAGVLRSRLAQLSEKVKAASLEHDGTSVMIRIERYLKLKLKIQHMSLVKAMYGLKNYRAMKDIPQLIFAVKDDVPGVLLGHSRIKKVVVDTVNEVSVPLLEVFHKLLDEHLVAAQKEVPGSGGDSSREDKQWTAFVSQARDSLLAFTMVNMLPTVLTETSGMILEKFQATLDEALTPTWGRYHYHLQVLRSLICCVFGFLPSLNLL
jgi:hypothetical protein